MYVCLYIAYPACLHILTNGRFHCSVAVWSYKGLRSNLKTSLCTHYSSRVGGGGVIPQLTLTLATMHVANISQVTMSMSKEVKIHVRVSAIVAGSRSFRVIATALNGR